MNQALASRSGIQKALSHFLLALLTLSTLSSGCKQTPPSASGPTAAPEPRDPAPPTCPSLDTNLVQAPQSKNGHRVVLHWNPSLGADSKHSAAVGYCIYRGPKPDYPPTELINHLPFPDTKCVDDSVENGKKYYYFVRAISAKGVPSDISRPPAPAKIPKNPKNAPFPSDDSTLLCREPPAAK